MWGLFMKWNMPPVIKIYEAMGAVGDNRISIKQQVLSIKDKKQIHDLRFKIQESDENKMHMSDCITAFVDSSSHDKKYVVMWDPGNKAIMANDNGSYWQGYVGYPAIALLIKIGVIKVDDKYCQALAGIKWKQINAKYRNDYEKTLLEVKEEVEEKEEIDVRWEELENAANDVLAQLIKLDLQYLGKKVRPPG